MHSFVQSLGCDSGHPSPRNFVLEGSILIRHQIFQSYIPDLHLLSDLLVEEICRAQQSGFDGGGFGHEQSPCSMLVLHKCEILKF